MVKRPVTIHSVAERAGVSPSVVSFVLNKSQPVSTDKRERVLSAVAELGYEPNRAARSLRLNRTGIVGVLVPNLVNPTQAAMAASVEQALAERDYLAVICATGSRESRKRCYFRMLHASRVDGLLIYPTSDMRPDIEAAVGRGLPVVHMVRELPLAEGLQCDGVLVDQETVVGQATEQLLALGHRRIALITLPDDSISGPVRIEGYLGAYRSAGVGADPDMVFGGDGTVDGGYQLASAALALTPRPTALVVTTSPQMIGAVQAVRAAGLQVPRDLSLVGSNATVPLAPGVALTVWDYPVEELGRIAVEVLFARLSTGPSHPTRRIVLQPALESGTSVAPPA